MKHAALWLTLVVLIMVTPLSAQDDLTLVRVGALPFISFAPLFIADEEGYFAEQGIAVEYFRSESGGQQVAPLLRGELDVYGGSLNAGLLNVMGREPGSILLVADKGYLPDDPDACETTGLVARPGLLENGTLSDPDIIRGLRFDANSTTLAFTTWALDVTLGTYGLTLEDVQIDDIDSVLLADSLLNGAIDASYAVEPLITRLADAGAGELWIGANDVMPGTSYGFIGYGRRMLNDPDLGERFMIAYLRGARQYNEGKTERNLDILEAVTGQSRALLEASCFTQIRSDGAINLESIIAFQEWAVSYGFIDRVITDPDALLDTRFIDAANAALEES
jgi:NitT/TauT family transport system substrate-binding protein